jgi:5-methylcytosine-specific restriction protein A
MKTYLLTWNPKKFDWNTLEQDIARIQEFGFHKDRWSCGRNKSIVPGSRVFMLRQGKEPRGIFASGHVLSQPFEDIHWTDGEKTSLYIDIRLDTLLNPENEPILPRYLLNNDILNHVNWDTQASGISIREDVAKVLEQIWENFLESSRHVPTLTEDAATYREGRVTQFSVNRFERNQNAREACIFHFGYQCRICNFDFQQAYGEVGKEFIHVHHLNPVADHSEEYQLDPINDLIPVCPNCHAIIHRRYPPYSIEEMKDFVQEHQNS